MRKMRPASILGAVILVASASLIALAQTPATPAAPRANVTLADYTRALGLQAKYTGQALNVASTPVWLSSGKFWYSKTVKGGKSFVLVDPAAPSLKPAFDHQRLAVALSTALAKPFTAVTLPFTTFT
ncbi:MAG TPA: hypothetical protein VMS54_07995, partial [Vicinamibacterales bacterium]|nr:hypothetical protein [Vicinamibacterales bacterium]